MKKIVVFFLLVNLYISSLCAFSVTFFTPAPPKITIKNEVKINFLSDVKNKGPGISSSASFDFDELVCDAGFNLVNGQWDFTTQCIYWPKFGNLLYTGFGFTYHLYNYPASFIENDFFLDWYLKINFSEIFQVYTRYGLFVKDSIVYDTAECVSTTMNFELYLNFFPSEKWCCYGFFNSSSYFDYPLFLTLFFGTGVENEVVQNKVIVGMELLTKWYDGVVVSMNPGHVALDFYCKVKL